jgi:hypothetical protein
MDGGFDIDGLAPGDLQCEALKQRDEGASEGSGIYVGRHSPFGLRALGEPRDERYRRGDPFDDGGANAIIPQRLGPTVDADPSTSIAGRIGETARVGANQRSKTLKQIAGVERERVQDGLNEAAIAAGRRAVLAG